MGDAGAVDGKERCDLGVGEDGFMHNQELGDGKKVMLSFKCGVEGNVILIYYHSTRTLYNRDRDESQQSEILIGAPSFSNKLRLEMAGGLTCLRLRILRNHY